MSSKATDFLVRILGDASNANKVVDQFGNDLGKKAGGWGSVFKNAASVAGGALAAIGIDRIADQVVDFGQQSVDAFKEAEESQAALERAYQKFPAIADVNISKLRELNTALQSKTGFDDDQIASSQATLAQFGLTGEQIQKLTPLMLDYAAKTGSDLSTSAEAMGKAVMGQGRALKAVGIDFADTGSAAGNFDQIVNGLDGTVGGFAETMGSTGAGKAKILEATFGDLQETIGEKLLPIITNVQSFLITDLIPAFAGLIGWVSENSWVFGVIGGVILAVLVPAMIAWAAGIWATTVALLANPVTWIILAIVALIAAVVLLVLNWDNVVKWITQVWAGFIGWITGVINGFVGWWNGIWTAVGKWISDVWRNFTLGIQLVWNGFWGWLNGAMSGFGNWIRSTWEGIWSGLGGIVKSVWNGVLGWVEGGVNGAIGLINGMIAAVNNVGGVVGINIGLIPKVHIPRLATGGVTTGPMFAMVGDNPGGREYIEPVDDVAQRLERVAIAAAAQSHGGTGGPVSLTDATVDRLAQRLAEAIYPAIKTGSAGAIRTAFGG